MASSVGMRIAVLDFNGAFPSGQVALAKELRLGVCLGAVRDRGSEKERIIRVLHPDLKKAEPIFYRVSEHHNINDAIRALREQEGYSEKESIAYHNFQTGGKRVWNEGMGREIAAWGRKNGFDGVVWVNTPPDIAGLVETPSKATRDAVVPLLSASPTLLRNTQAEIQRIDSRVRSPLERSILAQEVTLDPATPAFQKSIDDFIDQRMLLPQTDAPEESWYDTRFRWGPDSKKHGPVEVPKEIAPKDHRLWKQRLIVTLARRYEGLQHCGVKQGDKFKTSQRADIPQKTSGGNVMRGHFPGRGYGLDCSNFVSWVYNLGLGIHFTQDCGRLVDHPAAKDSKGIGRPLATGEKMEPGDLIFLDRRDPDDPESPPHVLIYCGTGEEIGKRGDKRRYYIDSTSSASRGVAPRVLDGAWCEPSVRNKRFVRATRPLDLI